jgi:hypothetical protein
VPIGLQFGVNPGSINGNFTEPGSGLRVESGQTLALIGGPLRLSGASEAQQNISSGFNKASPAELRADEGQIILGSVGDNEFVKLSTPSSALNGSIDFTEVHQFQDIQLQNGLRIGGRDFKKIDLQGRQIFLNQGVRLGEPAYLDTQNQGMISISAAERLQLLDSFIFSQTIGPAKGGDILIQSPQVILDNNSVISVSSDNPYDFSDLGSAGNITILSDQISLNHESGIQANSATIAPAGNIQISTKDLNLNQGASITSDSQSGQGGNLNLTVQNALILRNGSNISTSSTTTGNGGNIRINAGIIGAIPTEDSNINTTAESGNGGAINISTQGLLGIYPNLNGNAPNSSDITAKSQSGVDGIVNTNIFTTNTVVSFTQPPIQLNQKLVKVSCFSNQQGKGDRFVNSGQGGLPTHPSQIADQAMVWQDLRPIHASQSGTQQVLLESRVDSTRSNLPTPLVEAQGWIFETDGSVNLVSEPTVAEPSNLQADRQPCLVPTS